MLKIPAPMIVPINVAIAQNKGFCVPLFFIKTQGQSILNTLSSYNWAYGEMDITSGFGLWKKPLIGGSSPPRPTT